LITALALLLPAFINNDKLILAKQLINNTNPVAPETIGTTIGTNKHVVINISQYQAQHFEVAIAQIETLLQRHRNDKSFSIEIVANKNGLKALDTETSLHADRISLLAEEFNNLKVVACAKSMADFAADGHPIQLMQSIIITPSAAQQVAKRMGDGWMCMKI